MPRKQHVLSGHEKEYGRMVRFYSKNMLAAAVVLSSLALADAHAGPPWPLAPFWSGTTMSNECVLFIKTGTALPTAKLLFTPTDVVKIVRPYTGATYTEGVDYTVDKANKTITLTAASGIPYFASTYMYPTTGHADKVGGGYLQWFVNMAAWGAPYSDTNHQNEGHQTQVEVTYHHAGTEWASWGGYTCGTATTQLSKTLAKLNSGSPLKMVLMGDSISAGGHASGSFLNLPPYMPAFGTLVAETLRSHYNSDVTFVNVSVAGQDSYYGLANVSQITAQNPDLVIMGFGVNDCDQVSHTWNKTTFKSNIQGMITAVKTANPDAEIILIGASLPNPEWTTTVTSRFADLRTQLVSICGSNTNVVLADITSVWWKILDIDGTTGVGRPNSYSGMVADNIIHPNDFGHRLTAQALLALLGANYPAAPVVASPNSGADFATGTPALTLSGTCDVETTNQVLVNGSTAGVTFAPGTNAWSYTTTLSTPGANVFTMTAVDLSGNVSPAKTVTVTYSIAPTCTVTGPSSPTNAGTLVFTVNFNEPVTGLSAAGITVGNGVKGALTGSGTGPYTLLATPSGQGAVTCQVGADAAQNGAGTGNLASNIASVTYDGLAPVPTVTGPASPTNAGVITFTIDFDEPVSNLTAAGISVGNGTMGTLAGSGAGPYTLPVTPLGQGTVTCRVIAGAVQDAAANGNAASSLLGIVYDSVAPGCTVSASGLSTNTLPVTFTINFSEPVAVFAASKITVGNGIKGTLAGSGAGPYTLPVTPLGQGAVYCQVDAGAAQDGAGNGSAVSNALNIGYDTVSPTCTVAGPSSSTGKSPVNFTINFSESVSGLTAAGITVGNGTKGALTGSGAGPYTLPVIPLCQGRVTCQVNEGAAQDAAANGNTVSNTAGVVYDSTLPTGTIIINGNQTVTNSRNVTLALTWSDGTGSGVVRMRFSDDGATWSAWEPLAATRAYTLPGGEGYKTVRVMYRDAAGNNSVAFNDYIRVDTIPPTGTIVINNNEPATNSRNVMLALTWSDGTGSGVVRMRFSIDGATWSLWEPTAATRAYTLPAVPGYYTVRVTYRDAGGNISERFADYIRLAAP